MIAFDRPDLSDGFGPLPWLQSDQFGGVDYGAAQHLSLTVVPENPNEKDPFWSNAARTIVASAAVLAYRVGGTFADALGLAYQLALEADSELPQRIAALRTVDPWAAAQLQGLARALAGDRKLAGNIGADLIARFSSWTTPAMLSIFSRPGFALPDVLDGPEPHAVFLLAASHHSAQQAVVIASAIASAHRIQRRANRLSRPLWFLLDEFGNVGHLPNILDALTTLPGAGVSVAIGLQSVAQMEAVYGESAATVALEALHGFTAFPGLGYDSAQWVSDRLGQSTVTTWSRSTAADNTRQWTRGEHQRPVLMSDEVSRIRIGSAVVQRSGYPGLMIQTRPYYANRRYAAEAAVANPSHPQIAAQLNQMRHPVIEPPGAWDLGEALLERLLPEEEPAETPTPPELATPPEPPAAQSMPDEVDAADLKFLLKGGESE